MVQFGTRSTPNDVEIMIIRNNDLRTIKVRYVDRLQRIDDLVTMFAHGASKCYIHSSVVQDVSFMQEEFLKRTLNMFPYVFCSTIVMELEDCVVSPPSRQIPQLPTRSHLCPVHHK